MVIRINGHEFTPVEGYKYQHDYVALANELEQLGEDEGRARLQEVIKSDLWFIVYFVVGIRIANCPHWLEMTRMVQKGPRSHTLDVWGREHGKTQIISVCDTIRIILNDPEERIALFSYSRGASARIFRQIKAILEKSEFLQWVFPDILYSNPKAEALYWSEDAGLYVQRKGNYPEATLAHHGLIEGMPTGYHYSGRVYDDIVTMDLVNTPELMEKVKYAFDMSSNLGTVDGWHRVIGTFYHHDDPLVYIRDKLHADGSPIYTFRRIPSTIDGAPNSPSRYLPEKRLSELRANKRVFFTQHLLNPTPIEDAALHPDDLVEIPANEVPSKVYKFMVVDPAGVNKRKDRQDAWGIHCIAIQPYRDSIGASNIYIVDSCIDVMTPLEAHDVICQMYSRNAGVRCIGIEKVAMSTVEIHVSNALRAKGINLTVENGGIKKLTTAGRSKQFRIENNLAYPLRAGKIHYVDSIPHAYIQRLKMEMEKFPFWHDDGLDALAYFYDLIKEYRFGSMPSLAEREKDVWDDIDDSEPGANVEGWIVV